MTVCLVILNYNDAEIASRLLEKVGGYQSLIGIVVADNGSTDGSEATLMRFSSDRVAVFGTGRNGGYAYGNNRGAQVAIDMWSPDALLFANPDVDFEEGTVVALGEALACNPGLGAVAPTMISRKGGFAVLSAWRRPGPAYDILSSFALTSRLAVGMLRYPADRLSCGVVDVDVVPGSLFMVRTAAFKETGGFDEATFLYCEERILSERLRRAGYRIALDADYSYFHDHGATIGKEMRGRARKFRTMVKSKIHYYHEYRKFPAFAMALLRAAFNVAAAEKVLADLLRSVLAKAKGHKGDLRL